MKNIVPSLSTFRLRLTGFVYLIIQLRSMISLVPKTCFAVENIESKVLILQAPRLVHHHSEISLCQIGLFSVVNLSMCESVGRAEAFKALLL